MVNYIYLSCKVNLSCDKATFVAGQVYKIVRKSDYVWTVLSEERIRVPFSVQDIRKCFEPYVIK